MPLDYPNPSLTDDVVELRPWTYADLECVEAASGDARIPAGTTVPALYTEAEGRAFIERQWSRRDEAEGLSLAIADASTTRTCGLVCLLHRADPSVVGLGYWVIPGARSRGFATRAVALLVPWVLSQDAVVVIEAIVESSNVPSVRVLERAGFAAEGEAEVDARPALRMTRRR